MFVCRWYNFSCGLCGYLFLIWLDFSFKVGLGVWVYCFVSFVCGCGGILLEDGQAVGFVCIGFDLLWVWPERCVWFGFWCVCLCYFCLFIKGV